MQEEEPVVPAPLWYRLHWQVELVFKRFKSLAQLEGLPKYDDDSAKAWLYGKLFVALLVEKLIHHARAILPWGYDVPAPATTGARDAPSSSCSTRSRAPSNRRSRWQACSVTGERSPVRGRSRRVADSRNTRRTAVGPSSR